MQEHGGKISVDSEVGVGTVFTLDFPPPAAHTGSTATTEQRNAIHA
jgi:signal transduction histidine kinase